MMDAFSLQTRRQELFNRAQTDHVTIVRSLFRMSVHNDGNVSQDVPFRINKLPFLTFLDCQLVWIIHKTHNSIRQSARACFVWKWPAALTDISPLISEYLDRIRKEEERASIFDKKKTVITSTDYVGLKIAGTMNVDNWHEYSVQPPLAILPELWDYWQLHHDTIPSILQPVTAADVQPANSTSVRTSPFHQVIEQLLPALQWKNDFPASDGQISTHISDKLDLLAGVSVLGNRPAKLSFTQNLLTLRIGSSHFAPNKTDCIERFNSYRQTGAGRTDAAAVDMSLEEILNAWNYAELVPLIPKQIKGNFVSRRRR